MCHKSELPNELDFRTTQIAGVNVLPTTQAMVFEHIVTMV